MSSIVKLNGLIHFEGTSILRGLSYTSILLGTSILGGLSDTSILMSTSMLGGLSETSIILGTSILGGLSDTSLLLHTSILGGLNDVQSHCVEILYHLSQVLDQWMHKLCHYIKSHLLYYYKMCYLLATVGNITLL